MQQRVVPLFRALGRTLYRLIFPVLSLCLPWSAPSEDFPRVSVCDVVGDPTRYDGKMVAVHGLVRGTDEGVWLVGEACPKKLITTWGHVWHPSVWLAKPGDFGITHQIDFDLDEAAMNRAADTIKRQIQDPKLDKIWATYIGRIETRPNINSEPVRSADGTLRPAGFGHLNRSPAQLIIQSIADVRVEHPRKARSR